MAQKTDIIFCGNPGTGKSTIATSVSGIQFQSGISFGSGLTVDLIWNETPALPGVRFADTPGLVDMELAEQASRAITAALAEGAAKGHNTKIIFVLTLEGARIRTEDLYTIKTVMNSIRLANGATASANSYAVIINKCTFLDHSGFHQGGSDIIESMLSNTEINPIPSACIKYLPEIPELAAKANAKISSKGLQQWVLKTAPFIQVVQAERIDTNSQEQVIAAMKEEHEAKLHRLDALLLERAQKLAAESQARQEMEASMKEKLAIVERRTRKAEERRRKEAEENRKEMARLEAERKARMERMERERKEQQQAYERAAEQRRRERQLADEKEAQMREREEEARREENARLAANWRADMERAEQARRDAIADRERAEQARRAANARSTTAAASFGPGVHAGMSSSGASVGASLAEVSTGGVTLRAGGRLGADSDGIHLGPISFKLW